MNHPKVKRKLREIETSNETHSRETQSDVPVSDFKRVATVDAVVERLDRFSFPQSDDHVANTTVANTTVNAANSCRTKTKRKQPLQKSWHHTAEPKDDEFGEEDPHDDSVLRMVSKRLRKSPNSMVAGRNRHISALVLPEHAWFLISLCIGPRDMLTLRLVCRTTYAYATDDCNWETMHGHLHGKISLLEQVLIHRPVRQPSHRTKSKHSPRHSHRVSPRPIGLASAFSSYSPRSVSAPSSPSASAQRSPFAQRDGSGRAADSATWRQQTLKDLLVAPPPVADARCCYKHRLIFHFYALNPNLPPNIAASIQGAHSGRSDMLTTHARKIRRNSPQDAANIDDFSLGSPRFAGDFGGHSLRGGGGSKI